jgi:hypothetical protein
MGSAAPAHLAVTCYTELAGSHGLVLLRGDVLSPELINTAEVGGCCANAAHVRTLTRKYRLQQGTSCCIVASCMYVCSFAACMNQA